MRRDDLDILFIAFVFVPVGMAVWAIRRPAGCPGRVW